MTVGIGREIITPEIGGFLFGYNDKTRSTSVHDDLNVTALIIKTEETSAILISFTVCLIHESLVREISEKAGAAAGIPAENVIVSATHTHSGPPTTIYSRHKSFGAMDREYCDKTFIPKCVEAVKTAAANLKPAKMGVGTTESKVGINRRQLHLDNSVSLGQNPWDHYDSVMTVISFAGADDLKPIANIVHVGAHCTAAGNNHEITRDWAGVMVDRLDAESGGVTLFANGTLGDVAPRMANGGSTGDLKHAMEVGGLAGIDAVRAFKSIKAYYDEPLKVACREFEIPFVAPIPKEDIPGMIESCGEWDRFKRTSLEQLADLYEEGNTGPDSLKFRQVIFRIGPVVLVPYPFEVSSEIGLRLRNYSSFAHTLTMSCTNGSNSYLPAQSQICRGGYEINSFLWFRPRQLPNDTDRILIEQNLKLMEDLK